MTADERTFSYQQLSKVVHGRPEAGGLVGYAPMAAAVTESALSVYDSPSRNWPPGRCPAGVAFHAAMRDFAEYTGYKPAHIDMRIAPGLKKWASISRR